MPPFTPMELDISEIFKSIQGESSFAGLPCVFIRLSGCNLDCTYCDTRYSRQPGQKMALDEVVAAAVELNARTVEVTGGEPLAQEHTPALLARLQRRFARVLLETNGSLDISCVPDGVVRIVDIKCPSSGQSDRMLWGNLDHLGKDDEIKFVISDRNDFDWALTVCRKHGLFEKAGPILISPVFETVDLKSAAEWILESEKDFRLQLQLHKIIWHSEQRGV